MTSKNSYWKLSRLNMKRRVPYLVVSFLICFIFITIISYFETRSYVRYMDRYDITNVMNDIMRNIAMGNYFQDFVVIALAVLMALTGNSWNNSQKKNDFYKSLPVKERTRFIYIHLNSLIIFVISFGINLILVNLIAVFNGFYESKLIVATLYSFGIHTLEFIAVYMVAVIAQYLTGNMILAVCLTGVFGVAETVIRILLESYKETFYKTYLVFIYDYSKFLYKNWTSPVAGALQAHQSISNKYRDFYLLENYTEIWPGVIKLILQIVIYTAIAYYIYSRRPAQNGDKNFIFSATKPFIKGLITVPAVSAFVLMVVNETESVFVPGIISLVVALVILHIVLQFVIEGDFAAVRRGLGTTAIAGVIVAGVIVAFYFNGSRFDNYKPKLEDVNGVSISTGNEFELNFYNNNASHTMLRSSDYFLNEVNLTDRAFVNEVVEIISNDIDNDRYYYDEWAESGNCECLDISFNMNNGKRVVRRYTIPAEDFGKIVFDMYDLDEYRHYSNQLEYENNRYYIEDAQKMEIVYYNYGFSSYDMYAVEDKEEQKKLLSALSMDHNLRGGDIYQNSVLIGSTEIRIPQRGQMDIYFTFPVYAEDVNTIEVFNEMGYEPHGIDLDEINEIQIVKYDGYMVSENENDVRLVRGDDMFDEILENFVMLEGHYRRTTSNLYASFDVIVYNNNKDSIRGALKNTYDSAKLDALFEK